MEQLQAEGLTVVKLSEKDTSFDFIRPFTERLSLTIEKIKNRVPLKVLVFFTRQLATMFSAGLTIERALFFLSQEETPPGAPRSRFFMNCLLNYDKIEQELPELIFNSFLIYFLLIQKQNPPGAPRAHFSFAS